MRGQISRRDDMAIAERIQAVIRNVGEEMTQVVRHLQGKLEKCRYTTRNSKLLQETLSLQLV